NGDGSPQHRHLGIANPPPFLHPLDGYPLRVDVDLGPFSSMLLQGAVRFLGVRANYLFPEDFFRRLDALRIEANQQFLEPGVRTANGPFPDLGRGRPDDLEGGKAAMATDDHPILGDHDRFQLALLADVLGQGLKVRVTWIHWTIKLVVTSTWAYLAQGEFEKRDMSGFWGGYHRRLLERSPNPEIRSKRVVPLASSLVESSSISMAGHLNRLQLQTHAWPGAQVPRDDFVQRSWTIPAV